MKTEDLKSGFTYQDGSALVPNLICKLTFVKETDGLFMFKRLSHSTGLPMWDLYFSKESVENCVRCLQ